MQFSLVESLYIALMICDAWYCSGVQGSSRSMHNGSSVVPYLSDGAIDPDLCVCKFQAHIAPRARFRSGLSPQQLDNL